MDSEYLSVEGKDVEPEALTVALAIDFVKAVVNADFCTLIGCKITDDNIHIVIFETDVECPQNPVNDIRKRERIAVYFPDNEDIMPVVFALRSDFPAVTHINLTVNEFPRSLCIYEETYDVLKLKWTSVNFLEDIRGWLSLTAKGKLHADDQHLEFFLPQNIKPLIIPVEVIRSHAQSKPFPICVRSVTSEDKREIFIIEKGDFKQQQYALIPILGLPQTHRMLRKLPTNLLEFHNFLETAGVDLIKILREKIKQWHDDSELSGNNLNAGILNAQLIILCILPKKRGDDQQAESYDLYAYKIDKNLKTVGHEIGLWDYFEGTIGGLLGGIDESKKGAELTGELMNTIEGYDKEIAQLTTGLPVPFDPVILAVGLGAIGSQIVDNFLRMGYGYWDTIDNDLFLPHNVARHALSAGDIGYNKTERFKILADNIQPGIVLNSITADILHPAKDKKELLNKSYTEAEVILDMSTSIPVARKLASDIESPARRISAFLSPTGNDSVILSEDVNRTIPLNFLEMAYYRFLTSKEELANHLEKGKDRKRYGNTCRDISFRLPQDLVAIQSGILTRGIRDAINTEKATIIIWKKAEDSLSIQEFSYEPEKVHIAETNGWTVMIDDYLVNKLSDLRAQKLPNETGGVLIGSYDMLRKIVYIVDTIPSPVDSIEWPVVYIRGCRGLANDIEMVVKITDKMLSYIGEWHSHPKGASCIPSSDDKKAFIWLTTVMASYGLPALMMIVSEKTGIYLGQMED